MHNEDKVQCTSNLQGMLEGDQAKNKTTQGKVSKRQRRPPAPSLQPALFPPPWKASQSKISFFTVIVIEKAIIQQV